MREGLNIECPDIEETGERGSKYKMLRHREKGLNIELAHRKKGCTQLRFKLLYILQRFEKYLPGISLLNSLLMLKLYANFMYEFCS